MKSDRQKELERDLTITPPEWIMLGLCILGIVGSLALAIIFS